VTGTDSHIYLGLSSGYLTAEFYNPTSVKKYDAGPATAVSVDPGTHHVAATADATTLRVYLDGSEVWNAALVAGSITLGAALTGIEGAAETDSTPLALWSNVAAYSSTLTPTQIGNHYRAGVTAHGHPIHETGGTRIGRILDEIGHPSGLRNVSTGGTVQGAYLPAGRRAMDLIREIERSEQGIVFHDVTGRLTFFDRQWLFVSADADGVVFSDDGGVGAIGYIDGNPNSGTVDTVRNSVTVSYSTVGGITNKDATSIAAYGPSAEFIDCPTLRNGTDASNIGRYVLRLKKDPTSTIPRLTVPLRANIATNFAPMLGLELGDNVTVERTPMGVGSQIVRRHMVLGIGHEITPDDWRVEVYMSPAVPMFDEVPYFTIAHATYGRVGAPAGRSPANPGPRAISNDHVGGGLGLLHVRRQRRTNLVAVEHQLS
jgi:hypothetical protein